MSEVVDASTIRIIRLYISWTCHMLYGLDAFDRTVESSGLPRSYVVSF